MSDTPPTLEQLMQQNLDLSQKVFEQNKKIQRRLTMMTIADYVRIIMFVIPFILAAIFLPPLLSGIFSQYGALLSDAQSASSTGSSFNIKDIVSSLSSEDISTLKQLIGK